MIMLLRVAIVLVGIGFLFLGFVGVFRTERFAEALALGPVSAVGWVSVRVLIGAPYIAMGAVSIFAAARRQWAWLAPISAIEGAMALARVMSGFTDGFEAASVSLIAVEAIVCLVFALAVILPARSEQK